MFAVCRTSVDELDQQFLDGLKKAFAHKEIEITVSEADETGYLSRSPPQPRAAVASGCRHRTKPQHSRARTAGFPMRKVGFHRGYIPTKL
jgi:hypothetical protein